MSPDGATGHLSLHYAAAVTGPMDGMEVTSRPPVSLIFPRPGQLRTRNNVRCARQESFCRRAKPHSPSTPHHQDELRAAVGWSHVAEPSGGVSLATVMGPV
jgi:hypothetical protein